MKSKILILLMITALVLASGCASDSYTSTGEASIDGTDSATETQNNDNGDTGMQEITDTIVVMETTKGNIEIELYADKAPITVKNFLEYVNVGYYDGTVFHRVISGFMIQGGGFTEDGTQKKTMDPIKNEADNGLSNEKGTIAMARTTVVDSATSQFFINVADNTFLDHGVRDYGYAVFGKVTEGYDIVEKIESAATGAKNGMTDWPEEEIVITKAYVKE